ncbi:MAG TPA: glucokinase [Rhodanobacteraceae bacterium]|nr:glucokinase [Rhodanobacteraceae bacterium]
MKPREPALIGDIGGTNARFALTDLAAPSPRIFEEHTFGDDRFATLREAALEYLKQTDVRPKRATLAVAAPVTGDQIAFANRAWSFRRGDLQRALSLDHLELINDFGAIGWAAPRLDPSQRVPMAGDITGELQGPVTLIGPGTGLGVGLLVGPQTHGWRVVETEGGHATFAATDDEEREIVRWIAVRHVRVYNELLLSGQGLSRIDAALRGVQPVPLPDPQPGLRTPKEIVDAALHGNDADARRALDRFCNTFGSVAGDVAMLHGTHTVLIAGGIVLHFLDYFCRSGFMQRFTDKGQYVPYMHRIAVQVITHPNPGLLGAAVAMRSRSADAE